jgi:hypothetical protein
LEKLEVSEDDLPQYGEPHEMKAKLADIFATKTQVCHRFNAVAT